MSENESTPSGASQILDTAPQQYDRGFPFFDRPEFVGEFTVTDKEVTVGRSAARYVNQRALQKGTAQFNLNEHFTSFVPKPLDASLTSLLNYILTQTPTGSATLKQVVHEADVVSLRGILKKMAATPLDRRDAWRIHARKFQNVVFLLEDTTEKAEKQANLSDRELRFTYWGFKFEQYMCAKRGEKSDALLRPPTFEDEFMVVVKSRLGSPNQQLMSLYFAGEVDCIDDAGQLLELKTQANAMEGGFWGLKSLGWWLQSFLLGVKKIVVGLRNHNGIVTKVQRINTETLPKHGNWKGGICFNFLSTLLDSILRMSATLNEDAECIRVQFDPATARVTVEVVPLTADRDPLHSDFKAHFLPPVAIAPTPDDYFLAPAPN